MLLIERKSQPEMLAFGKVIAYVKANIALDEKGSSIILYVPGFKKEQLSLMIEKRSIVVEGLIDENPFPIKYLGREFSVTSFRRKFDVSDDFDLTLISAILEDGVLRIRIPRKVVSNQIKQISIQ